MTPDRLEYEVDISLSEGSEDLLRRVRRTTLTASWAPFVAGFLGVALGHALVLWLG